MDLKKRLAQLDRMSRRQEQPGQGASDKDSGSREQAAVTLGDLDLAERATTSGPVWIRTRFDPVPAPDEPLPNMREIFSRAGDSVPGGGEILFLDTETTGLAGGTGTIPFLVGVSWWGDGGFETRQYFLPEPGHEPALLEDLGVLAADFEVLVTFNGASFDLPLLRTRARLNRLDDPLAGLQVWDLLVPSRRLWGHRLANCRQQTLESEVCGIRRTEGDIDGSRIPQVWFDFLSDGRPGLLPNVLTHNQRDMVGMGRLFLEVVEVARRIDGSGATDDLPWHEAWALGRICERRRDSEGALGLLSTAAGAAPRQARGDARFLSDAIRILKRGGDWPVVENLITGGLRAGLDAAWLHREAAILYEHRLVDLPRALDHALESGEDVRVERLRRLLARAEAGA